MKFYPCKEKNKRDNNWKNVCVYINKSNNYKSKEKIKQISSKKD